MSPAQIWQAGVKGRNYTLEINEEAILELRQEEGLTDLVIVQDFGNVFNRVKAGYIEGDCIAYGLAEFPNKVTLFLSHGWMEYARMDLVKANILHTLLHEIRHIIQFQKGMGFLTEMDSENDANEWARKNRHKWSKLIRIKFSHKPSLSRLSQAEARARGAA